MEECLRKLGFEIVKRTGCGGGGCISQGEVFSTDKGKIFVKKNTKKGADLMFEGELKSLQEIESTNTIKVPHPYAVTDNPEGPGSILIMEYLDMKYITNQSSLGTALANLHLHNSRRDGSADYINKFGFHTQTCCGFLPQSNVWQDNWVNYYTAKLQEQVDRLQDKESSELWPQFKARIGDYFEEIPEIKPSLVHGDLWSGNAAQCNGEPVVFDAACFYGHDEYDLGIAKMFGGFDKDFYSAYHAIIPKQPGFEQRNKLYQLFHQLNHWNHFGSGYRASSLRIIKDLIKKNVNGIICLFNKIKEMKMGEYKDLENQFKYFWEKEPAKEDGEVVYTLDYFDEIIGDLQDRECPTAIEFAAAMLREILVNMKPSHPLWDKIKHAALILHLATRSKNFLTYFNFFHEMEYETSSKNLTWKHRTIQTRLLDMVIEQVDQLALLAEIKSEDIDGQGDSNHADLNNDIDYYENDIENDKDFIENSNGIGDPFEMSNIVVADHISEQPKFILSDKNDITVKPEKNEDESADKENLFDTKVNCSIADDNIDDNKDNIIVGEKKSKIKLKKNKTPKKLKRVKKEKYEEESPKEKKAYYVKKEKKNKMFQCSSCDYSSDYHAQIDQHTFKQHSSLCTQCGHQSETFKEYQEHAETHPYSCEICKVKFVGIRTLRRHMTTEHQTENLYTKEKKMVPCHICGKLVGEPSLRGHIKNIHSTEIHKCDFCDFTTNRAMKVRVHMKKHLRPAKPCPECGKNVKSLAQHFRLNCSSTVQKQRYPCPICEKTFSKKDGMHKHIRNVHDNTKNNLCNFCDYKTNSSFNLKLHVSKMHTKEELEVECQFCNIKTRGLEYHLKIYHFKEYQEIKQTGLIHKVE